MRNGHHTDLEAVVEREWEALLVRLRKAGAGDVRLQRVRHAIASGEFQVDARAIAGRLIARYLTS